MAKDKFVNYFLAILDPMINNRFMLVLAFILTNLLSISAQKTFDQQGRGGCRGLMPENTLPAFLKAVEMGVNTLQMDVVISMDGQVVLSHEPWMSPVNCSHPNGKPVLKKEAKALNLYQMKYAEIQQFDCGKRLDPDFPEQQRVNAIKPTLKMVAKSVQRFATDNQYKEPRYAIELRSNKEYYDIYSPKPEVFVELIVNEIRRLGIDQVTTLQSSDINILEELNKIPNRHFMISFLSDKGKNHEKTISKLSFKPDIYSPHIKLVSESTIREMHNSGIKLIPWPVNTSDEKQRIKTFGADGYITDYPEPVLMK